MPTFFRPGQAIEVSRRQAKAREANSNPDYMTKLESAETKLHELKSNMATLGKEASAAMAAVEAQQQRLTLQRLIAMVILSSKLSFTCQAKKLLFETPLFLCFIQG